MKTILFLMAFMSVTAMAQGGSCAEPFFSEYIEGSSSNKAFEVYNPAPVEIDLTDYVIYRYNNGSLTATDSLFPQGMLASHDVFVVANPSANAGIIAESDTTHTMTFYNGDDAISLINLVSGDTLDLIGEIGVDPGSGWTVGSGATNNTTLIRMIGISEGQTDWVIGATEWDVFPIDMIDSLGAHTSSVAVDPLEVTWTYVADGLTASFTNTSGDNASNFWDFGDGITSTEESPEHTYAVDGDYTVCLTVVSFCGEADSTCATVSVSGCDVPVADYSFVTDELEATFTNASVGTGITYVWDFGDGETSTETDPVHDFAAAGDYIVCLLVTNDCGADTLCDTITVCTLPNASYTFTTDGLTADFTDASTGGVSSYSWDFGDGETSTDASPSHEYAMDGAYDFCLIVTNDCGNDTLCDSLIVCGPIAAGFTTDITALTVDCTNESTGGVTNYAWDFGDGTTSLEMDPSHTYSADGIYTICLKVKNSCGVEDTICETIEINTSGIAELEAGNSISIYPNPTTAAFTLSTSIVVEQAQVIVTDVYGRVVNNTILINNNSLEMNLEGEAGIYFVTVLSDDNKAVIKLVKK